MAIGNANRDEPQLALPIADRLTCPVFDGVCFERLFVVIV
jgi:hypothetical protein